MREPERLRTKTEAVRRPRRRVPGGKALARLHSFELERGFPETGVRQERRALRRRKGGEEAIQASPYLAAFRDRERLEAAPAVPVPTGWRCLGPFAIPHGQTYGSGPGSRPGVTGRISAIAVDPRSPNHILIGAAGGGVWQTQDGGASWRPRTDAQPSLATGAIAFDPAHPDTVYAGTGEGNFFRRLGAGLLRSSDGGVTWTLHATSPFAGAGFFDLIVDPLSSTHLLAATSVPA